MTIMLSISLFFGCGEQVEVSKPSIIGNGDSDGDGYGDELDGFQGDQCPNVYGLSFNDRFGCPDTDRDGWSDPDENWTLENGADAYINDPLTHIYVEPVEPKESEEEKARKDADC